MFDLREEQQYERLRKLGQELHLPIPEHFITLEVFDKDGKLIQKHHQRSHSWNRNAYNLMFSQLAGKDCDDAGVFEGGKLSLKRTSAGIWSDDKPASLCYDTDVTVDSTAQGYRATAGNDEWGILVGSGTDAESFEDYALQTLVIEGAGAGQLNYAQSEAHDISWDGGIKVLKNALVRYFNNNSGGDVSVSEVGLGFKGVGTWCYLNSRDKLALTMTVPDTGQLKVTYTIQLTYPA